MASEKNIQWEASTKLKFEQMVEKVPVFLRGMAQEKVEKRAFELVAQDQRTIIEEKDLVTAFFDATPFGFHGPMKCDMEELGIDYTKYGFD
ncbi:MAG: DUF2621 family protein [Candidatus Omnitrophica bacterium]|nr:DUF2621 family protein [Candidatus Omnitrophota bacterium]MCB9747829.1 DUF2621 family protein [Candidatus Omnitrophota bacterium]